MQDTNLRKKPLLFSLLFIFGVWQPFSGYSQDCPQGLDFDFNPSPSNTVNWAQFPEFSLPFKVAYAGSNRVGDANLILKRGFSHMVNPNGLNYLQKENRAFIYYNVAEDSQPWKKHKSPYGNDMDIIRSKWDRDLENSKANNGGNLDFDIFCLDFELHHKSNDSIIALKQMSFVPDNLKALSDAEFIKQYKIDMQALYGQTLSYVNNRIKTNYLTSYGDVPIFNNFSSIQAATWENWISDPTLLNYIDYDFNTNTVGGKVYSELDILSPNAYFYYDYPHIFAGEYLSYLLFQIEANRAWSDKDQMVFLWGKYSYTPQFVGQTIRPWMAEAMAVFPFFSGAKGIWFWEDPFKEGYSSYEYFTKGLYRLSKFKSYFEGDYELIQAINPRVYNENQQAIWRGVLKDGKLLIAAQNPWADSETTKTEIAINYGSLYTKIALNGYDLFLCEFEMPTVTGNEELAEQITLYPNPSSKELNWKLNLQKASEIKLRIVDNLGKVLLRKSYTESDSFAETLNLENLPAGQFILNLEGNNFTKTKKIIIE